MDVTSYHFLNANKQIIFTCHAKNTVEAITQWNSWSNMRPHYKTMLTTLLRIDSEGQWEEVAWG